MRRRSKAPRFTPPSYVRSPQMLPRFDQIPVIRHLDWQKHPLR